MSNMARGLLIVAVLLVMQTVCQAKLPTRPCNGATPLKGGNGTDLFCGRGPDRVVCPPGSYCDIHPADLWAECCPRRRDPVCANRKPGVSFVNARCTQICTCDARGRANCGRLCPILLIRCQKFYVTKFFKVPVPGTKCACSRRRCVPVTPRPCFGDKPLIDPRTGSPFNCFRKRCPSGAFCHSHPADAFSVCCRKHTKPGRCPKSSVITPCRVVRPGCVSDRHCPGNKKCCRHGCSSKCLAPVRCGPVCAIFCRYGNVFKGGCPTCTCRENPCNLVDCPRNLPRCIVVNRQAKCVRVVVPAVKPGRCPRRPLHRCRYKRRRCSSDASCRGRQKCCWLRCTRQCVNPVRVVKPGKCPNPRIFCKRIVNRCSTDANCRGRQKCCFVRGCGRRCVNPAPVVKPGKCPRRTNARCRRRVRRCRVDSDCRGRQKCCTVDRCGRKCVNPAPVVKPGLCPNTSGIITPCVIGPSHCLSDSLCLGRKKCCPYGCGRRCLNPVPVKPVGPCPKPTGPGICVELCGRRKKCTGGTICCSNGCGHQCMNPVRG